MFSNGFGGVHGYFLMFRRVLKASTVISWFFERFWKCPRLFLGVSDGFGGVHGYFLVF